MAHDCAEMYTPHWDTSVIGYWSQFICLGLCHSERTLRPPIFRRFLAVKRTATTHRDNHNVTTQHRNHSFALGNLIYIHKHLSKYTHFLPPPPNWLPEDFSLIIGNYMYHSLKPPSFYGYLNFDHENGSSTTERENWQKFTCGLGARSPLLLFAPSTNVCK